ncbi:MAG: NADase-type glycan-binding domain-containing protein [Bacteroidota bacterium]
MKNQPIKYIQEKLTIRYRRYYSFILLLSFLCACIHGQITDNPVDIELIDTMEYTLFGTEYVPDFRYSPAQLFDAGYFTCWVSHIRESSAYPSVFVALPKKIPKNITLNIFSGYGKSESLYFKNSRPREIQITFNTALVPDGYVSEHGLLCKAFQSPKNEKVILKDTFGIQSINLQTGYEDFKSFHQKVLDEYKTHFDASLLDTLVLAKIEINSIYQGTVYDDICISEIFFNDCYLSAEGNASFESVDSIYMNETENTLLIDTEEQTAITVYNEQESMLQIADITPDNRFAILISVPVEAGGRVETQYRVIDLVSKEEISGIIENLIPGYNTGEPVFFEHKDLRNFLVSQSDILNKIELRYFK